MTVTNRRLQKLFRTYNRKYFGGRLPAYKILRRRLPDGMDGWCIKTDEIARIVTRLGVRCTQGTILIDTWQLKQLNDRALRFTLLHEMCHIAAVRHGHGNQFYEQMMNRCPQWAVDYQYRKLVGMTQEAWMLKNFRLFASSRAEVAEMFRKPKKRRNNDNSRTEK